MCQAHTTTVPTKEKELNYIICPKNHKTKFQMLKQEAEEELSMQVIWSMYITDTLSH